MKLKGNIAITGGAGTLGTAIMTRAVMEQADCQFTVISRDPIKHLKQAEYFDKDRVRYVVADVCEESILSRVFVGHDLVIHAAAQKHIPQGESDTTETIRVNLLGSLAVAKAALQAQVKQVIGISTDKACHPVNAYGATKMLMERLFQEYDRLGLTRFYLVRYGNVLGSTGSVVNVWKTMLEKNGSIQATSRDMTRFWMTANDAVDLILSALFLYDGRYHGAIIVPKMKSLDMGTFAKYVMPEATFWYNGLRPGEKKYEELVTKEELPYTLNLERHLIVHSSADVKPFTSGEIFSETAGQKYPDGYTSDNAERLSKEELLAMI